MFLYTNIQLSLQVISLDPVYAAIIHIPCKCVSCGRISKRGVGNEQCRMEGGVQMKDGRGNFSSHECMHLRLQAHKN